MTTPLNQSRSLPPETVLIVGGGLAGLATAIGLAQQRVPSVILESRPRLGGRASSFQDHDTEQWIDNCQHVTMGCCTNFRHFCELTGIADQFDTQQELYFVAPDGRVNRFHAQPFPAPFHLAAAFAGLSYLTWKEKLALGRGIQALARTTQPELTESMDEWLSRHDQPVNVRQRFWHVVLVSALSESLDRIGVAEARQVLVEGFLANSSAWRVDIPRQPLEILYGEILQTWLQQHGVEVHFLTAAAGVEQRPDGGIGVDLRDGGQVLAHDCVLAVPFHRLNSLLPTQWQSDPFFSRVSQLQSAPISSLHLWFDRPIMPLPHAVFVEGLIQWVFDRTPLINSRPDNPADFHSPNGQSRVSDAPTAPSSYYYQVVISASRELQGQSMEIIRQQVLDGLQRAFPAARSAQLLSSRQVTEHRAVFSPLPGSQSLRPSQATPVNHLWLAGDYTQTGWPATMEGAVRSGFLAAEQLLQSRGITTKICQPALPVSPFSRWLLGIATSK